MGKNLIQQKRGRGVSPVYFSPSHRFYGSIKHYPLIQGKTAEGKVIDLVKCPGHNAPLAIVDYGNKEQVLMPATENLRVGDTIATGINAELKPGNTLPLKNIPEGTFVYNIESMPGDGGKFVRTAGTCARVVAKMGANVTIELPSKKQRVFNENCRATIGAIAGSGAKEKPLLKAGKAMHIKRAKNKLYPRTSGVAMNAVNHPFGSGRGRHVGKPKTVSRNAPPGRKVGLIAARRAGKRR